MPRALKFELSPLQLPTLHSCSRLVSRSQTHSQSLHGYARSAVAQHCPSPSYLLSPRGRSTFGKYFNAYLKFTVYGRKQARTYVNTLPQCSPASVGLAQARPNKWKVVIFCVQSTVSNNEYIVACKHAQSLVASSRLHNTEFHM